MIATATKEVRELLTTDWSEVQSLYRDYERKSTSRDSRDKREAPTIIEKICHKEFSECDSPSLRFEKFVHIGNDSKKNELMRVCELCNAPESRTASPQHDSDAFFVLKLGSRMMVDMAGGVLENAGLCLHRHFGYPCIPGSAIKGIARHAAWTEWVKADKENQKQIADDIARVFGYPTGDPNLDDFLKDHEEGAGTISFLEAVPDNGDWQLACDVLTPHGGNDYTNPLPCFFIAVEKGADFRFSLKRTSRAVENDLDLAESWLRKGLCSNGAGAKSAAGYGWFVSPNVDDMENVALSLSTPGFLGGALHERKNDTALRVASLRGMLRWWWRTLYRGLLDESSLKRLEAAIWGAASEGNTEASKIVVRVTAEHNTPITRYNFKDRFKIKEDFRKTHNLIQPNRNTPGVFYLSYGMDDGDKQRFFVDAGAAWDVSLSVRDGVDECRIQDTLVPAFMVREQALIALSLLCRFGGIGAKARKGFGSLSWNSALSLDECKSKAQNFCDTLGLPTASRNTDYSLQTALMDEVQVPLDDPWTVLDRLGAAVQKHAQNYKHQDQKAVLGLPRKIHGPRRDPMRHQNNETFKRPENLQPDAAAARNGSKTRFAAPVFYHIEKLESGGSVIRMTAFPSDMIRDRQTSERLLRELLETIKEDVKATASISQTSPPRQNTGGGSHPKRPAPAQQPRNEMAGGLKSGARVKGVLSEEKTKKGGWKVEVAGHCGAIVNTADVPSEKSPGDPVEVIIHSAKPENPMFKWAKDG